MTQEQRESRKIADLKILYPTALAIIEKHLAELGIQLLDTFEFPPAMATHWTLDRFRIGASAEKDVISWLMTVLILKLKLTTPNPAMTLRDIVQAGGYAEIDPEDSALEMSDQQALTKVIQLAKWAIGRMPEHRYAKSMEAIRIMEDIELKG